MAASVIGIPDITSRIGEIQRMMSSRVASNTATASSSIDVSTGPADPNAGFDPFGTVYQQALAGVMTQRQATPATQTATGASNTINSATAPLRISSLSGGYATRRMTSSTQAGAPTGATTGRVGGYDAISVPPELAGYGNGRIPASALELIGQGQHRLWAPAAEAWQQMVAAAKADGVDLSVTDSYRSYDNQVLLAQEKGLTSNGGWAAFPGTSNHGWGVAVDMNADSPAALAWLRDNGHRFGWVEAIHREPWHWEFRPGQA